MTTAAAPYPNPWVHEGPWSEDEYLALPEDNARVELVDGSLLMTPAPGGLHQQIARRLANLLEAAAEPGTEVLEAVNVRVAAGRILIPDVVVTRLAADHVVFPASAVELVCEVVSPSTVAQDRILKAQLYAAAGIPAYLRVEMSKSGGLLLVLGELAGATYAERERAETGMSVQLPKPVAMALGPGDLLGDVRRPAPDEHRDC